uniref:Glucagon-like peptide 1 receptor n=1 Tax=Callorhinchus milii TaxID=7868 RepID=A0A4W3IE46_CALMI
MYICWPDGFPGTTVNVSCPWYLPWQSRVRDRYAFRYCSDNGSWLLDLVSQGPWADSSQCAEDDAFLHQQRKLRFVYTAGYTLSLISLVAFLLSHRKLRCTRNYIHVNLFSSFILRAISVLLKDSFTDSPDSESVPTEGTHSTGSDTVRNCEALWRGRLCICSCILLLQVPCRAAQLLLHYSVASSWYWLLVEGIFLYTLLVLSVFSPTKSYRLYLMIGWGLPLAPLIPWTLVKYFQENSGCWRQNSNMGFWWILRAPLLLINVAIFVRIMMLLISKMRSHQMQNTDFRYRLTKSTLILIPMLGVHEIVLALVTDEMAEGTLRYLKLSVELFFGSVQVQTLLHTFSGSFINLSSLCHPHPFVFCLLGFLGGCPLLLHQQRGKNNLNTAARL